MNKIFLPIAITFLISCMEGTNPDTPKSDGVKITVENSAPVKNSGLVKEDTSCYTVERIKGWEIMDTLSNYSIQYPREWKSKTKDLLSFPYPFYAPNESEKDSFRPHIAIFEITYTGHDSEIGPNKGVTNEKSELKKNAGFVENKKYKGETIEYYKLIFSQKENNTALKTLQYNWFVYDTRYALSFTAREEKFAQYEKIAEKILTSFKLKR